MGKKENRYNYKKIAALLAAITGILLLVILIACVPAAKNLISSKLAIAERTKKIEKLEKSLSAETKRADAAEKEYGQFVENLKKYGAPDEVSLAFMRHMFPDYIVLQGDEDFSFHPIDTSLAMHTYKWENLTTTKDGAKKYVEKDVTTSKTGIDVSSFQHKINWKKVASDHIDYAMIRLGYRGYVNGTLMLDEQYEANIKGAAKYNLDVGVYFFTQAVTTEEAAEEADFVLKHIKKYKITYPVAIDTELIETGNGRANGLSPDERTAIVKAFCDRIRDAGYKPMIYANLTWFVTRLHLKDLEGYDKWFAGYEKTPAFPYDMKIWQYTNKGSVKGISTPVDRNISFLNYAA